MKQKAFFSLCCAIIAAVLFISCGGPEERKMKFFNKGNALYEKGDYLKARLEFKNVLQIDPKFARAYHRLGECEIKLKNVKQAFAYMNKAVEYDPQLWEAQLILAQMLFLAGQTDEAKKRVALVLENRPEHTNALLFKSHMLIQENHSDEAEKILRGVIEIDPDSVKGYLALAALLEKTSGPQAAEKILKQGMERNEKSPALLLATAGLYMNREDFLKAESIYEKLVQYYPERKEYAILLARYHVKVGQPEKAERIYKTLIKEDPGNAKYRVILAGFYQNQQETDAQIEVLKKAVADLPEDPKLPFVLAEAFLKNNRIDPALKTYQDIVENHGSKPEAVTARLNIAKIYFLQKKMDPALTEVNLVLKKSPTSIDARSLRGKIFLVKGKGLEAVSDFRQVIKGEPDDPEAYLGLAKAHLQNNEDVLALEALKKAVNVDPRHETSLNLLLRIYQRDRDYDSAISLLKEIVKEDPENTLALSRLGDFHLMKGDAAPARTIFEGLKEKNPDAPENFVKMSIVYIKKGDYKAAEAQLDHALTLQPENTKILARAVQLQMLLKKPENALQKCRDHIEKVPSKEAGIRVLISQVYGAQKDFDRARKEITQAMNLKPDSMVPYTAMGRLLLAEGKVDQGIEAFKSALQKRPDSVQLKFLIATLHEKKEDYTAAVTSYEKVLKEHPGFIPALNNLAYLYADRFANRENIDQAQKLLAEIPKERFNAYILDTIGLVHYKREEYKEAIEVLKSAESKDDLPIVQLHLALAYIKTDQRGLALEAIEKALLNDGRGLSDEDLKLAQDTRSTLNRL